MRKQDGLRRAVMFEPRGHTDMYGALLTERERADSDAGVLFMHNEGFSTMCGHGIIAVVTIAIERGILGGQEPGGPGGQEPRGAGGQELRSAERLVTLDAPAGQIRARAEVHERPGGRRVSRVSFVNVPSFVLAAAVPVQAWGRLVSVDVAFGGAFYAIVDAESVGLPVAVDRLPELRQAGAAIARAVEAAVTVTHPTEPGLTGVYGTIFTAPPSAAGADLKNVTVFADREVDRSPCGTGTCAVLAVLDAMSLVDPARPFVHESVIGSTFSARVLDRTSVGPYPAIVPELSGDAWITGEHTFYVDSDDPLREGFRF
jgi:trans-L-3-hydroxyproline dehydratase